MNKTTFILELIQRFKTESPDFFKKLMKYSIIILAMLFVFYELLDMNIIDLNGKNQAVMNVLSVLMGLFGGTTGAAMLPKVDPNSKDTNNTSDDTSSTK